MQFESKWGQEENSLAPFVFIYMDSMNQELHDFVVNEWEMAWNRVSWWVDQLAARRLPSGDNQLRNDQLREAILDSYHNHIVKETAKKYPMTSLDHIEEMVDKVFHEVDAQH